MEVTKLLPCPFCGEEAYTVFHGISDASTRCLNHECNAMTVAFSKNESAKRWNRRHNLPLHVQACRPEDRAMLKSEAGQELLRAATTEMRALEPPAVSEERAALTELLRLYDWRFELAKMEAEQKAEK